MSRESYSNAPTQFDDSKLRSLASVVNRTQEGKLNSLGDVTLTAGQTTTTVNTEGALLCGPNSQISLTPLTANAAAALGTTYISSRLKGSFVITHANAGTTDRSFTYSVLG